MQIAEMKIHTANDNPNPDRPFLFKELGRASGISLDRGERTASPHTPRPPVAPLERSQHNIFVGLYHYIKGRMKRCRTLMRRKLRTNNLN